MFWICLGCSTVLFFSFFSWLNADQGKTIERFYARLVAFLLCSIFVLLDFLFKKRRDSNYTHLFSLGPVIAYRVVVFLINMFWVPGVIDSNFMYLIHGLVLACIIISVRSIGLPQSLPLVSYFSDYYFSFNLSNQIEKKSNTVAMKKEIKAVAQHTFIKHCSLVVGSCLASTITFYIFPAVDRFLKQNWVPICLPWFILMSYYFLAVVIGKNKRKHHRQRKRSAYEDQHV